MFKRLPTYAVAALAQRKQELLRDGVDVIDLGPGDPDIPPPELAVTALSEALRDHCNQPLRISNWFTSIEGINRRVYDATI